jgi:hypothetical protein
VKRVLLLAASGDNLAVFATKSQVASVERELPPAGLAVATSLSAS